MQAASRVRAGDAALVIAGGAESASTAPHRLRHDTRERYARAPFAPSGFADPDMGPAAEHVARVRGITRARQDARGGALALRAAAAQAAGVFDPEIVPVDGIARDDRPRASMDAARLARFAPAFAPASASLARDGASAAARMAGNCAGSRMAPPPWPSRRRMSPAASAFRRCAWPRRSPAAIRHRPGSARAAARAALARAGMSVGDLGFVEITEAFAAQLLAVSDDLGLDEETISGDGGAIALGHPWGASGAILLVRSRRGCRGHRRRRRRPRRTAACSIGGGQGIAMIVERVA